MGPNVAGVIGSAVAAGVFISLFGDITVSSDQTAIAIDLISNITALP
jgi:oxaloacetate decarboxylase beta subunit